MLNTIESFLKTKYNNVTLKPLTGGYTNEVFLIENTFPPEIAKVAILSNLDSLRESICLKLLNEFNCTPKLKNFFQFENNNILIMDYINGISGQYYLDNNYIKSAKKIYTLLGENLSKIHSIQYSNSSPSLPLFTLSTVDISSFNFLSTNHSVELNKYLPIKESNNYVLIHGDFGPHNSIFTDNSLYIIDWEWSGFGHPLQDISWTIWLLKFHYPTYADELSRVFIDSYIKNSKCCIDLSQIKSYALFKIITIIDKIPLQNLEAKNEWLKRLSWTLKTDFNFTI